MLKPAKKHKSIVAAVSDMMEEGRLYVPGQKGVEIESFDLYDLFKHKLTKEAQQAIECVTTHSLLHERNEELTDLGEFFDFLAKTGNQGVKKSNVKGKYYGGYIRVLDKVMFIGKTATVNKLETAVDKVCNGLNKLANKGYITATLAPLHGIKLQRISKREKPKIIVVSYVAVTEAGEKYMKEKLKGLTFEEGRLPKKV